MDEFITLSKKIEFSASHRYWNDSWSEEENLKHFGKCTSKYGHGHNYVLETTVEGPVDPDTGMIINIYNLLIFGIIQHGLLICFHDFRDEF